jgi:hypothetical protein
MPDFIDAPITAFVLLAPYLLLNTHCTGQILAVYSADDGIIMLVTVPGLPTLPVCIASCRLLLSLTNVPLNSCLQT